MSKSFIRFAWITLISIMLVILAGSVVRTTGAGMGCPDWPTCFGKIIPPTSEDQLPENYRETFVSYRQQKVEKFARIMAIIGFEDVSEALRNDPDLVKEEPFNRSKTWTEYANRLVGFLAGNFVLVLFIWVAIRYRSQRLLFWLSLLNLILMGFEGWFGSIVVATNLVPWTITVHMFIALIIVAIQLKIIRMAEGRKFSIKMPTAFRYLFYFFILLTFTQIVLGSQVRQEIDFQVKEMVDRSAWISNMEGDFLFHRSFSWVLLGVNVILLYLNHRFKYGIPTLKWMLVLLLLEFVTGVLFSYAGMPAFSQPLHLLLATFLLGMQLYSLDFFRYSRNTLAS